MKKIVCFVMVLCLLVCGVLPALAAGDEAIADGDETKISVISDIHYLPPEYIGSTEGFCFRENMDNDRKLVMYGDEIINAAFENVEASGAEFLLVPGDLAHSCQKLAHERVAAKLRELESRGVQVYVIPGNHDICPFEANTNAIGFAADDVNDKIVLAGNEYVNDRIINVDGTSKSEFERLYSGFGCGEDETVIARAEDSLSYVAELGDSVRLIAIDASYYDNDFFTKEKGLDSQRLEWVKQQIAACLEAGKTPVAMMHYNLVEKYRWQSVIMGPNFVDDNEKIAKELADCGLKYIFTGHSHATDIAALTTRKGAVLNEICTGGLMLHGSPVRHAVLAGGRAEIKTTLLPSIEGIEDYQAFCNDYYYTDGIRIVMRNRGIFDASAAVAGFLESDRLPYDAAFDFALGLMQEVVDNLLNMELSGSVTLCDVLTQAYKQHYAGDEQYPEDIRAAIKQIKNGKAVEQALGYAFRGIGNNTGLASVAGRALPFLRSLVYNPVSALLFKPVTLLLGVLLGSFLEGIFIDGAPADNNVKI